MRAKNIPPPIRSDHKKPQITVENQCDWERLRSNHCHS